MFLGLNTHTMPKYHLVWRFKVYGRGLCPAVKTADDDNTQNLEIYPKLLELKLLMIMNNIYDRIEVVREK